MDESIIQRITNFGDDFSAIFPCGSSSYTLNRLNPSSSCSMPLDRDENMGFPSGYTSDSDGDSSVKELHTVLAGSLKQLQIAQAARSRPEYLVRILHVMYLKQSENNYFMELTVCERNER